MQIEFTASNTITAVGTGASFTESDIGAKLIAPSIFNATLLQWTELRLNTQVDLKHMNRQ
ncbi:MAG: hypothetical protein CM15mV94_110 [uncultured marine virus]|nr:MAG: hypothetical protein CM15mV94_110 [uncultured marine virus]